MDQPDPTPPLGLVFLDFLLYVSTETAFFDLFEDDKSLFLLYVYAKTAFFENSLFSRPSKNESVSNMEFIKKQQ